jgi:hypothetical protein
MKYHSLDKVCKIFDVSLDSYGRLEAERVMFNNLKYFFILGILFFISCEKYINSQTDSNLNDRDIIVSGKVIDSFRNLPIHRAEVDFGGQSSLTDYLGQFELPYRLTVDNERNKPVELTVISDNYFDYKQEIIIAPIDLTISVYMIYAAPMVKNSVLVPHYFATQEEDLVVVQALVFDYQGADEIDSVRTTLYYRNERDDKLRTSIIPLRFVEKVSQEAAHYQAVVIPTYQVIWHIQTFFNIYVEDTLGYSTEVEDGPVDPWTSDTLIFPPIYYQPKKDSIFSD